MLLPSRRVREGWAAVLVAMTLLSGCATPRRLPAVPRSLTVQAAPAEGPVRFWPGEDPQPLLAEAQASQERYLAYRASQGLTGPLPPQAFLAISGGGDDGAFGAGLLAGWTQAGDRPEFRLVTGVSTGALIAPFAFLGPKYDKTLWELYTQVDQRDIFRRRPLLTGVFSDALADTTPLAKQIRHYVTPQLLAEIAAEYAKGRLLLVGTTDLDSRRGVIWNMGAIAASKDPQAIELFRHVTLASASIPGVFPPVMIDVTVDGKHYQEMHVDGGVSAQVFMYPPTVRLREAAGADVDRRVYIIRNGRIDPDWSSVDRRTLRIVGRSISALIQSQATGDLNRIYVTANRDKVDYNLAFIPSDFDVIKTDDFDPAYMRPLYERGYAMGKAGYPWLKGPPGLNGPLGVASGK